MNGNIMIEYDYKCYENVISITGLLKNAIGKGDLFLYKVYCYDYETGLYYLVTRYYDPTIGRFISSDDVSYLDPESIGELNLFSYCNNNPIMRWDPLGNAWWHWAIAAGIVIGIGIALVATAGGAVPALLALTQVAYGVAASSMATTVLAGALIGSSIALGTAAIAAMSNSNSIEEFAEQGNWGTVAITAGGGLIGAGMGYLRFANHGWTQVGEKTPGKSYPFGSYTNTKNPDDITITHYGWNGERSWSKHLSNHGFANHAAPHWHVEGMKPHYHSENYNTFWKFIKEYIKRKF